MQSQNIGISWQLSDRHGWGVFGLHLALNLIKDGPCSPLLFAEPDFIGIPEETTNKLRSYLYDPTNFSDLLEKTTLLHSLGNAFKENPATSDLRGRANVAFAFFEDVCFDETAIARANAWDRLLVGSTWNRDVCLELGLSKVEFVSQGIDINHFFPAPKQGVPSGRFVVYSGGKLEHRKGQDLVLAAFKIFHAKYPDSILVTAWQNSWIESAVTISRSPLIHTPPEQAADGQIKMTEWAASNGIDKHSFVDLGWVSNARLPAILREVDVALFPSRCEGGTNLAAMEAMASGVACVLSKNTGHLDLIDGENCYALDKQSEIPLLPAYWRESNVDEIVEKLEQAYIDKEGREQRAQRGAASMKHLSWEAQIGMLVSTIEDLL